jgi:hypothetical protein
MLRYALAFALLVPTALAQVPAPRVALVYSDFGEYRHRDDYDVTFAGLGWPLEKIENTRVADLAERLDSFDIILCGALYNYSNVQDLTPGMAALRGFLERGGVVVITDANYEQHVSWLGALAEGLEAHAESCGAQGQPLAYPSPNHPLLAFPHAWRPTGMWSHLELGTGWQVLASDADGGTALAVAGQGLGGVWLSTNWRLSPECLGNIWEWARTRRAGIAIEAVSGLGDPRPGSSLATVACRALIVEAAQTTLCWHARVGGTETVAEATLHLERDRATRADLRLPIPSRGEGTTWLTLTTSGTEYASPETKVTVPALFALECLRPAYRGALVEGERGAQIRLRLTAYPGDEGLANATVEARLTAGGRERVARPAALAEGYGATTDLTLDAEGLPAGEARVTVVVRDGREVLWSGAEALRVVRPADGTMLDSRLVTSVAGEPFFPIGVYHVGPEALPQARAMGFNCIQAWGNSPDQAKESLDAAQANGMKVLLEMGGLVRGGLRAPEFRAVVEAVREHPALLCWYPVDEPFSEMRSDCEGAYRICRELDPSHPVYFVLCDPSLFATFDAAHDVLGIDPYPVPGAPVRMVADWMRVAQASHEGRRPVWLIPQLHNSAAYGGNPSAGRAPTPEEEWCMVLQGLIYGAKGIIYYPWDDGSCGLTHEPALMEALPHINAFLAANGAGLASAERRLVSGLGGETEDPDLHVARFAGPRRVLLATNTGSVPKHLSLALHSRRATSLIDGSEWDLPEGRLEHDLVPLEVLALELR